MKHENGGHLASVRVIDFTQIAAGPTCTMMLADRGADVIKIEAPTGDIGRTLGPPFLGEHGALFLALNRNKRSVVLDLKSAPGLAHARQLIVSADVVVESFRPGVMERLGLGYATASQSNPGLIYCSISAYGQSGPMRDKPGVDGILQATTGLMSVTGAASEEPSKVQAPVVDMVTGFLATTAILDALLMRTQRRTGAWLDISMYAAGLQLQQGGFASYLASRQLPERCGSAAPYASPNEAFPTADGWLMVAAYQAKRWEAFCTVLGIPELAKEPHFSTLDARVKNRAQLVLRISALTRRWETDKLIEALESADIICGPVSNYADVTAHAQFAGMVQTLDHREAGPVRLVGPMPVGASGIYKSHALRAPPVLGEHTAEVLREIASASGHLENLPLTSH